MRPLEGIRVLDLANMWAAPATAMYLADQGADVVKIEPLTGDEARRTLTAAPIRDGQSRAYLVVGRNKRGMAVDLRAEAGKQIVYRLIPDFDVVIANFRPGVAERLRLDYDTLRALNRRLIYVRLTAYGDRGPFANRPGYDLILQSLSGMLSRRRMPDGTPVSSPVWAADMSTPMVMAYGVALALLMRERTGTGQVVEGSLLHSAVAMQAVDAVRVPAADGGDKRDYSRQAMYAPYRCEDGEWLNIVVILNDQFRGLCRALEVEHLADDPRFANSLLRAQESEALHEVMSAIFETRPRAEWLETLDSHDVPAAPILDRDQIIDHEQFKANEMFVTVDDPWAGPTTMVTAPVRLAAAEPPVYHPAPTLGQHTLDILREARFTDDEIEALAAQNVIKIG